MSTNKKLQELEKIQMNDPSNANILGHLISNRNLPNILPPLKVGWETVWGKATSVPKSFYIFQKRSK